MIVIEIGPELAFTLRLTLLAYILHVVVQAYTVIHSNEPETPEDASEEGLVV